jgi:diguanylate cyclase (GGDEF)-like protein
MASRPAHDPYRRLPSLVFELLRAERPADVRALIERDLRLIVPHDDAIVEEAPADDLRPALVDGDDAREALAARLAAAGGLAGLAVHRRAPVRADETFDDPALRDLAGAIARRGEACIVLPLLAHGVALGTVTLRRTGGPFTDRDVEVLHGAAELAALALHDAHVRGELRRLAYTDALTGLPNRRGFETTLDATLADGPAALLFVDLDGLKETNDLLGYEAGDRLLVEVAQVLATTLVGNETAARLGGDEFVTVVPGADEETARRRAAALTAAIEAAPLPAEIAVHYRGASVGAVTSLPADSAAELLRRAGAEMRARKRDRKS